MLENNTIFSIRNAGIHDLPKLSILLEQLGYPQEIISFHDRLRAYLDSATHGIYVAQQANNLIGFVAWAQTMTFVSNATRIRIEGLVVDQNFRNLGVGSKLMAQLEEFAQQFSPCIIELTSGLRRAKDGAHDFYAQLGYHNDGTMAKLYLRKEL